MARPADRLDPTTVHKKVVGEGTGELLPQQIKCDDCLLDCKKLNSRRADTGYHRLPGNVYERVRVCTSVYECVRVCTLSFFSLNN